MKNTRGKAVVSERKRSRTSLATSPLQSKRRGAVAAPLVARRPEDGAHFTFLTNHSHVLVALSKDPFVVLREVALQVGITERAVQRIIADLEAGGVIEREKVGRQNHYRIRTKERLRHAITSHRTIGELLALINGVHEQSR